MTLPEFIFKVAVFISVCAGACAGEAQCNPPSTDIQNRAAQYAAKRFHADPTTVRVASSARKGNSCYWTLNLVSGNSRKLTLYLSPDFQYLVPDLYDLAADPLDEERRHDEETQARLMQKHSATRGAVAPKITIVEFSDLQCPYCKNLNQTLADLGVNRGLADVQIVFKNFLIPAHDWAVPAAMIAECARQKDESLFWRYQDFIFAQQQSLDSSSIQDESGKFFLAAGARDIDLNHCISDPKTISAVHSDVDLGHSLGVRVTPTFFVNGRKYEGTKSLSEIESILASARTMALSKDADASTSASSSVKTRELDKPR